MTAAKPEIRHIYQNHHLDTNRWDGFKPRADDIIISTSYKAGTTWMQTIVAHLVYAGREMPEPPLVLSPWLDFRMAPLDEVLKQLDEQTERRFIKSHLPLDGLPYFDKAKYIMVGRDPRDVFMSLLNHWGSHTPEFFEIMNSIPERVGGPFPEFSEDISETWKNWITRGWFDWETDGFPYWSHLHHAKTFWEFKDLPNIELFHYADMLKDLEGEMRRCAAYLGIEVSEEHWPGVVDACTFATVKKDPSKVVAPIMEIAFKGGGDTFINKGTNGRWKGVLNEAELQLYEDAMKRTLPADCAKWLENGWNG
jgi:aryl sulfotransferase